MAMALEAFAAADHVVAGGQGAFDQHVAANGQAAGRLDVAVAPSGSRAVRAWVTGS
jgi:hypothetical protein